MFRSVGRFIRRTATSFPPLGPPFWVLRWIVPVVYKLYTLIAIFVLAVWAFAVALVTVPAALVIGGLALVIALPQRLFPASVRSKPHLEMPAPQSSGPANLDVVLGPYNAAGERYYDAVFEGGAVKAIAHIGAIKRFEEEGMQPRTVVGTSGGAILAALLAAGASAKQIWEILSQTELTEFMDANWMPPSRRWLPLSWFGIVPLIPFLVSRFGAFRGDRFQEVMSMNLKTIADHKSDPTFQELEDKKKIEFHLIATDATRQKALVLPRDIVDYTPYKGVEAKTLSVSYAVRMSMSIPGMFEPIKLPLGGEIAHIVDGGVSSNYPIWLLDAPGSVGPRYPTFGFLLDEPTTSHPKTIWNLLSFAWHAIQAGMGAVDRILSDHDKVRTIRIKIPDVGSTDFALTDKSKAELFTAGYDAADAKLHSFNWSEYVKTFRCGHARIPLEYKGPREIPAPPGDDDSYGGVTHEPTEEEPADALPAA